MFVHILDHVLCGVAVYKAGESLDKRERVIWLAVAALAFGHCHTHHHKK